MIKKLRLGDLLVKLGLITPDDLQGALEAQTVNKSQLGEVLLRQNCVSKDQLIPVLEYQANAKYVDLHDYDIEKDAVGMIGEKVARQYRLIPISLRGGRLQVAMTDPLNFVAQDDIRLMTGRELEIFLALNDELEWAINTKYTVSEVAEQAMEEFEEEAEVEENIIEENEEVLRAPIVRLINSIMEQAVRFKASDIHIEPFEKNVKIRIRVDGDLKEILSAPKASLSAISARIKILSSLDISEKRIPQDGRIEMTILTRKIDFRVSILPTVHGEKIVMRILDRASVHVTKQQLGFTEHNVRLFEKLLRSPEGIILLSGPTGSGKTTTLYTVLRELNKPNINAITVEDPVEYRLEGINQVQVNMKAGLTFASGLRSILRQDPDVVMVGEIRDSETAEIAIRAAITGHLVLSTIHTNDAVSTIMRLTDMGIEPFLVTSALMGVVAQRLVKKICVSCKGRREATEEERLIMGEEGAITVWEGRGCNVCGGSGYSGRTAIHEILLMDSELRTLITSGASAAAVKQRACEKSLKTLAQSCKVLVLNGTTTVQEMLRVTYGTDN